MRMHIDEAGSQREATLIANRFARLRRQLRCYRHNLRTTDPDVGGVGGRPRAVVNLHVL